MKNLSGRASAATGSSDQTGLVAKTLERALCAARLHLQGNANVTALPDPLNGTEEQLKEWAD
eukprot:3889339-Pyramimonas_sp.AAC.1